MPAVSTMLPGGYGRKVRAEWVLKPETAPNIFEFDTDFPSRADEWADSLGAVNVSMGNQALLGSDGARIFATPNNTGPTQLGTALDSSGDSYMEYEIPGGETYVLSKHWTVTKTRIDWADATVGASTTRVSDGAVVDFSDSIRDAANTAGLCIVRVKESPA